MLSNVQRKRDSRSHQSFLFLSLSLFLLFFLFLLALARSKNKRKKGFEKEGKKIGKSGNALPARQERMIKKRSERCWMKDATRGKRWKEDERNYFRYRFSTFLSSFLFLYPYRSASSRHSSPFAALSFYFPFPFSSFFPIFLVRVLCGWRFLTRKRKIKGKNKRKTGKEWESGRNEKEYILFSER